MAFQPVQANCKNCGASLFFDPTIKLSECDYCGSHIVLDQVPLEGDWPAVDWIFQDHIEQKAFKDKLAAFFTEHPDTPDDLLDAHEKLEQHLCYLPFYRYQIEYTGSWSADAGYYRTIEERHYNEREDRWEIRTRTVTDWSPASGTVDGVCAFHAPAAKECQGLWTLVTPLAERLDPLDKHVFDPQLLAGSSWMGFDTDAERVFQVFVQSRMDVEVTSQADKMVPGDTHRNLRCQWRGNKETDRELIPFWIYHYSYGGTDYVVALDAVAGGLRGGRPKTAGRRWVAAVLSLVPIILAGLFTYHIRSLDLPVNWLVWLIWSGLAIAGPIHFRAGIRSRKARFPSLGVEGRRNAIEQLRRFQHWVFWGYSSASLIVFTLALLNKPVYVINSGTFSTPTPTISNAAPSGTSGVGVETQSNSAMTSIQPADSSNSADSDSKEIQQFFQQWIADTQDPNADLSKYYADSIRYYLQPTYPKAQVLHDKASLHERYPEIKLNVTTVKVDFISPNVCEIVYDKQYEMIPHNSSKVKSGNVRSHVTFNRLNGDWKITSEWDQKRG